MRSKAPLGQAALRPPVGNLEALEGALVVSFLLSPIFGAT